MSSADATHKAHASDAARTGGCSGRAARRGPQFGVLREERARKYDTTRGLCRVRAWLVILPGLLVEDAEDAIDEVLADGREFVLGDALVHLLRIEGFEDEGVGALEVRVGE